MCEKPAGRSHTISWEDPTPAIQQWAVPFIRCFLLAPPTPRSN
ncbi:MAG TPA: hypothetical protein VNG51_24405 [Ktedonobacteraceae bacterium]|nr:hypothetical protein [Ktedonobacteraceae bacterium]